MSLMPRRYSVADPAEAIELCFEKGWTDGLPVVPPTEERVRAMLDAARLRPGDQVAYIAHRAAAVEGSGEPAWSYHGPGTSTAGAAVLTVVNGPVARELDINAGDNLFGPGWRANATIGRAVRLVMRNLCGARAGGSA